MKPNKKKKEKQIAMSNKSRLNDNNGNEAFSDEEKERQYIQNRIKAELKYQEWLEKKKLEASRTENENDKSLILKEAEFGWKQTETLGSIPPSDYTITHINQNYDLLVRISLFNNRSERTSY